MKNRQTTWSSTVKTDALDVLRPLVPFAAVTRDWAWAGSTGRGVKVAVIDSGIDNAHPEIAGSVKGYVAIGVRRDGITYDTASHADAYGHGTACAGIIRRIAPDCEIYSIKILGPDLTGRGLAFAAALHWAIENGMQVCNLSLGTTMSEFSTIIRDLSHLALCRKIMLVAAAHNSAGPSCPSMFASTISVAAFTGDAHEQGGSDSYAYTYTPRAEAEFGAPGYNVQVPWRDGAWTTASGNSYAAPHITGIVTKILASHPNLTVLQMKALLRALATNVADDDATSDRRSRSRRMGVGLSDTLI
jgi:subtilisin